MKLLKKHKEILNELIKVKVTGKHQPYLKITKTKQVC